MFTNATVFPAQTAAFIDEHGSDAVVVMAKATFSKRGAKLTLAEEQRPVRLADVPTSPAAIAQGKPSSLRTFGELAGNKRGADVVVLGSAISVKPVTCMDVAVRTPARTVALRVFGERTFYKSGLGLKLGPAAPFERAAVTYERAYGGTSADGSVVEPRNPVGRGVHKSPRDLVDAPAPCIEDPARPIEGTAPSAPMGIGAIASWWAPRRELMGTMDAAWLAQRMPVPPRDFDPRFHRVAHPLLQLERPLAPGDVLATLGLSEDGSFDFTIPELAFVAHVHRNARPKASVALALDTALLEPAEGRAELTFRCVLPLGRGATRLKEVRLDVAS